MPGRGKRSSRASGLVPSASASGLAPSATFASGLVPSASASGFMPSAPLRGISADSPLILDEDDDDEDENDWHPLSHPDAESDLIIDPSTIDPAQWYFICTLSRHSNSMNISFMEAELHRFHSEMITLAWLYNANGEREVDLDNFIPIDMYRATDCQWGMTSQANLLEKNVMFRHAMDTIKKSVNQTTTNRPGSRRKVKEVLLLLRGTGGASILLDFWKELEAEFKGIVEFSLVLYLDKAGNGGFSRVFKLAELTSDIPLKKKKEDVQIILRRWDRLDDQRSRLKDEKTADARTAYGQEHTTRNGLVSLITQDLLPADLRKITQRPLSIEDHAFARSVYRWVPASNLPKALQKLVREQNAARAKKAPWDEDVDESTLVADDDADDDKQDVATKPSPSGKTPKKRKFEEFAESQAAKQVPAARPARDPVDMPIWYGEDPKRDATAKTKTGKKWANPGDVDKTQMKNLEVKQGLLRHIYADLKSFIVSDAVWPNFDFDLRYAQKKAGENLQRVVGQWLKDGAGERWFGRDSYVRDTRSYGWPEDRDDVLKRVIKVTRTIIINKKSKIKDDANRASEGRTGRRDPRYLGK
ncbi:Hypothetical protein D9617_60g048230 [Elsinoe fawcettii]|nr:Hypothetical protein D9617_60g048230 [Elsinoe fawcettii]